MFSLSPVILHLFIRALAENKLYLSIAVGFILLISGYFDFRIAYVISGMLFLYFVYHVIYLEKFRLRSSVVKLKFLVLVLVFMLGNAYWLISIFLSNSLSNNVLFDRGLFGNDFFHVLYALTMHHPFWSGSEPTAFVTQTVPIHFFLIPVVAFSGLYVARKNKLVMFFGAVSLVGIFLSKQSGQPFPGVYQWLFDHVPGFNAFREASKFYFIIALGYSVLIGAFSQWLLQRGAGKYQSMSRFAVICIGGLFLINAAPLIGGNFGTLFVQRSIPDDYVKLNEFINRQPDYFRTLWIPTVSRWATFSQQHPILSFDAMVQSPWRNISGYKVNEYYARGETMLNTFKNQPFNGLLDMSSVKYIIVPLQDTDNADDFIKDYGTPRKRYVNVLSKIPYLTRINAGTKTVIVYENKDFYPKLYLDQGKPVKVRSTRPTKYEVYIPKISDPARMHFAETFDTSWRTDPITPHSKNEAGFNTFFIDPKRVQTPSKITLEFTTQSYVPSGTAITIVSLLLFAGLLKYDYQKFHEKNSKKK